MGKITYKSRGIAIVLALFLGGLGIHRFYIGQVGRGFLFMIFSWTFIPAFIGLIDALRWAFMSDDSFATRY